VIDMLILIIFAIKMDKKSHLLSSLKKQVIALKSQLEGL
jgi:hypothetical protein